MKSNIDTVGNNSDDFSVNYQESIPEFNNIFQLPSATIPNHLPNYGQPQLFMIPNDSHYNNKQPLNVRMPMTNYSNFPVNNYSWNIPYHNQYYINGLISKLAEDKMQPAFKSIEKTLQTFNSISTILHSTYSMLYGSFRTITGVVDHFIFIKNQMTELALFPRIVQLLVDFLKWLFNLLGIKNIKFNESLERNNDDKIWKEALDYSSTESLKNKIKDNESSLWPVFVFFSLVLGTPYIVWRLLGATGTNQPDWIYKNGRHFIAIGLNDFNARNKNELSFTKGQKLFIKPETLQPNSKWLLACTSDKEQIQIGVIPLNLVKIIINN